MNISHFTKIGLVGTLLFSLTACGGNQFGWEDAGDYDPKHYKVDADGVSLVAESEIDKVYEKHLKPVYGEAVEVKVSHSDLIDDFGDDYGLDTTTVTYYYEDISLEDLKELPSYHEDFSNMRDFCDHDFDVERDTEGNLDDDSSCWADLSSLGLPRAVTGDFFWVDPEYVPSAEELKEFEDFGGEIETRSFVSFQYDPRREGRSLF